jgi:hypothetical protein
MNSTLFASTGISDKLLNTDNLYRLLDTEPFLVISCLILVAWSFYKFFLKEVSEERHKSLKAQYRNLLQHFFAMSFFFALFLLLHRSDEAESWMTRATPYSAMISFFWGIVVLVKTCRVMVLQYLFLGSRNLWLICMPYFEQNSSYLTYLTYKSIGERAVII